MRTNVFNFERHAERLREAIDRSGDTKLSNLFTDMCCDCARRNSDYVILSDKTMTVINKLLK